MRTVSSLLLAALLLDACAGAPHRACPPELARCQGYGGSGPPEPQERAWGEPGRVAPQWWADEDEQARADEARYATRRAWAVASSVDGEGAVARFSFYSSGGALTPIEWQTFPATGKVDGTGEFTFQSAMLGKLSLYAGTRPRYVQLTFQRFASGWMLTSFDSGEATETPPEGRTLPVKQPDAPEVELHKLEGLCAALVGRSHLPARAGAEWKLEARLDDDRVQAVSTLRFEPKGPLASAAPEPTLPWKLANAIAPFLAGVGPRSVRLLLAAEVEPSLTQPQWRIRWAGTEHPARSPELAEFGTSFEEYRLLREEMLRKWREQTLDYAKTAAAFTAREVAIWYLGGFLLHGVATAAEVVGSPLWRLVSRLGPRAPGWLECLLVRVPEAERTPLLNLMGKMDRGGGVKALSSAERGELRSLLDRYFELAGKPLSNVSKDKLRTIARERFWKAYHPELVRILIDASKQLYPVHHLIPLEYAHLFVELDINAAENLVALEPDVHTSIGNIWTAFRAKRDIATAAEVRKVVAIIDRYFMPWYNATYDEATSAVQLQAAEAVAKAEVQTLLKSMRGP